MSRSIVRLFAACAVLIFLGGPAFAAGLRLEMPPPVSVPLLPAGTKAQPVTLTRIGANIAPGTPWMEETGGIACTGADTTYWQESNNRVALQSFERVFREQLSAVGLSGGRDPNDLFDGGSTSDLQAGALITSVLIKGCVRPQFLAEPKLQVSATMDIEWHIYSASKGQVISRTSTHGGFAGSVEYKNLAPVLTGLFADNVRRLAADAAFRQLIAATSASSAALAPQPAVPITFIPATAGQPIAKAGQGVVTVFAGDGWGSGILISADGYILTNHHVAAAGDRARIRWADGTETPGEVLRSDKRRDVALIRTTGRATPLALRHDSPQLGEPVFAIGTPLEKAFQNTVTRGVVSGVRTIEGQPFVQSDVAVDHGNSGGPLLDQQGRVIGITDWGYSPDGVSHSLNFFIPIDDALRVLALSPVPTVDAHETITAAPAQRGVVKKKR